MGCAQNTPHANVHVDVGSKAIQRKIMADACESCVGVALNDVCTSKMESWQKLCQKTNHRREYMNDLGVEKWTNDFRTIYNIIVYRMQMHIVIPRNEAIFSTN